jgi:hypothetical protein
MKVLPALQECRARAAAYLQSQAYVRGSEHWWRHSCTHDAQSHPDHLLYGTWAGALASVLLGLDRSFSAETKDRIRHALSHFQRPDGTFLMAGIPEAQRPGQDREYLVFHCTNYAAGAMRALGLPLRYSLAFVEELASPAALQAWLAQRDWNRPWREGNNVVNLASFYALLAEDGAAWARERLEDMAAWHDVHQNPTTGFWHSTCGEDRSSLVEAMAGGAHNLHIYYYLGRSVPRGERIIDSCLRLGYPGVTSACIDIDLVDILCHLRHLGHRVTEIDSVLKRYLIELLPVQNADGGFGDNYVTPHVLYSHRTPAGASVTWTTYFRLATIGMIASTMFLQEHGNWTFRNTMGMGYYNRQYASRGLTPELSHRAELQLPRSLQLWLGARRRMRWTRQRLVSRVRTLLPLP